MRRRTQLTSSSSRSFKTLGSDLVMIVSKKTRPLECHLGLQKNKVPLSTRPCDLVKALRCKSLLHVHILDCWPLPNNVSADPSQCQTVSSHEACRQPEIGDVHPQNR